MRYILYHRVSTIKQLTENQRAACVGYYEKIRKDGDIVIEFDEEQKTTRLPIEKRLKLKEMLDSVRKGDTVIVYKIDRLARHQQEILNIWFDLKKRGVNIVSISEGAISDEFISIYAFIASMQRKNISDNTRNSLQQRKRRNERAGTVPFGYRLDESSVQSYNEFIPSYGKPYKLIPHEEEQQAIRLMVDLYNQGESYAHIERELEAEGHKTRLGTPITRGQIYRILKRIPEDQSQEDVEEIHVYI